MFTTSNWLERSKEYIQEPTTIEKYNLLSKQLFYTCLTSILGRCKALKKKLDYDKQLWRNK